MDEGDVEAAMQWSRRTGLWSAGDTRFLDFLRMLQVRGVQAHFAPLAWSLPPPVSDPPACVAPVLRGGPGHVQDVAIAPAQLAVQRQIGKGAFGNISRATLGGQQVAVKFVSRDVLSGPKTLPQVLHEVMLELRVVKILHHPSVCAFLGAASQFPGPHVSSKQWSIGLVFELCGQGDMHSIIHEKRTNFSVERKLKLVADVAAGIAYLHSRQVVHRDLSTRNILLTSDSRAKICDFGCARILQEFSYMPSFISGSPPWMAPEQILGKPLTLAVDLYSFGSIMWELFTGEIPFAHRTRMHDINDLQRVLKRGQESLSPLADAVLGNLATHVKASIRRVIVAAHQMSPALRPKASDFAAIVESLAKSTEDHVQILRVCEYRTEVARRMIAFYKQHKPAQLLSPEAIPNLLDRYEGNIEGLNQDLLQKYNADLNSLPNFQPLPAFPGVRATTGPPPSPSIVAADKRHTVQTPPVFQASHFKGNVESFAEAVDPQPMHPGCWASSAMKDVDTSSRVEPRMVKAQREPAEAVVTHDSGTVQPQAASGFSGNANAFLVDNQRWQATSPGNAEADGSSDKDLNGWQAVWIRDNISGELAEWHRHLEKRSGEYYYLNTTTQRTQWEEPAGWPNKKMPNEAITQGHKENAERHANYRHNGLDGNRSAPGNATSMPEPLKGQKASSARSPPVAPLTYISNDVSKTHLLPPGWTANKCTSSGRVYYAGRLSKTVQWEKPTKADEAPEELHDAPENSAEFGRSFTSRTALDRSGDSDTQEETLLNQDVSLVNRAHEMEDKLRLFYAVWGVTNKDKVVPQLVAQHVGAPQVLDSLLRKRFFGTDLSWHAEDLAKFAENERRKVREQLARYETSKDNATGANNAGGAVQASATQIGSEDLISV